MPGVESRHQVNRQLTKTIITMGTNVINAGLLYKANREKPILNLANVMKKIKNLPDTEIISELPNTHQCFNCKKKVALNEYITSHGKRFCSLACEDMVAVRNNWGA